LIEDIRLFVSLVNWHLTLRLEHSEQLEVSVASHCDGQYSVAYLRASVMQCLQPLTLTLRSLQASQEGSFRRCLYARFCAEMDDASALEVIPGSPGIMES